MFVGQMNEEVCFYNYAPVTYVISFQPSSLKTFAVFASPPPPSLRSPLLKEKQRACSDRLHTLRRASEFPDDLLGLSALPHAHTQHMGP